MLSIDLITANKTLVKPGLWHGKVACATLTRIWFIKKGSSAWVKYKNNKSILNENSIYIIPTKSNFEYGVDSDVLIEWCHIHMKIFGFLNAFDFIEIPLEIKLNSKEINNISKILNSLIKVPKPNEAHASILFQKNILSLLEFIIPKDLDFNFDQIQGIQKLLPAIELMKQTMKSNVGINELAKSVHLERNYFSTLFKKVLLISPIQYYHLLRCQSAQSLLQNRAIKMEEIAQEFGYTDAFHFSKMFKKTIGISPSDFRKSNLINIL